MRTRTSKTFDCVTMKDDIQRRLLAEYEAVQDRYDSYWHFLQETNRKDPALQALREKLGFADPQRDQ
ncbi:MAG: hypothetical protein JXA69_16125 [Phycisphaerae bacterium]|nr:hypothetical protein [Phycisphaerae bacterium]